MKPRTLGAASVVLGVVLTLAMLPAVLATTAPTDPAVCAPVGGGTVEVIAATIRRLESGDDYTARAPGSTASGAYQFLDSSWAGYGGYPRAWLAPPGVQDAKAAELINTVLAAHDGDVSAVPVVWYIGHLPPPGSPEWDRVPAPSAGNRLTPRAYQAKWMDTYRPTLAHHTARDPGSDTSPSTATALECGGPPGEALPGGWALPGPRDLLDATADQINNPHHDYPAWDWSIPTGTPIYAVRGGTVVSLSTNPNNCYRQTGCAACGLGVIIDDDQGVRWTYCHGSAINTRQGDRIKAGQQILTSGSTGNSTGPHLHLAIEVNGVKRCPQTLIASLHRRGVETDPRTLPVGGCSY